MKQNIIWISMIYIMICWNIERIKSEEINGKTITDIKDFNSVVISGVRYYSIELATKEMNIEVGDVVLKKEDIMDGYEGGIWFTYDKSEYEMISSQNPNHRAVIASYPWGNACIVTVENDYLTPLTLQTCKQYNEEIECDMLSIYLEEDEQNPDIMLCKTKNIWQTPILTKYADSNDYTISYLETTYGLIEDYTYWEKKPNDLDLGNAKRNIVITENMMNEKTLTLTYSLKKLELEENKRIDFESMFQQGFSIGISCGSDNENVGSQFVTYMYYNDGNDDVDEKLVINCAKKGPPKFRKINPVIPLKELKELKLKIEIDRTGSELFSNVFEYIKIMPIENLISNAGMDGNDPFNIPDWIGSTYMPDITSAPSFLKNMNDDSQIFHSIFMTSTNIEEREKTQGASQKIDFNDFKPVQYGDNGPSIVTNYERVFTLYIGGYVKAINVNGLQDDNLSINFDAYYTNFNFSSPYQYSTLTNQTDSLFGQTIPFPVGTYDWIYRDKVLKLSNTIDILNITTLFREHSGSVWFDNIFVRILHSENVILNDDIIDSSYFVGGAFTGGNIATLNNILFPVLTPGEYILFRNSELEIQIRNSKLVSTSKTLTQINSVIISGVSIKFSDCPSLSIEYEIDEKGYTKINNDDESVVKAGYDVYFRLPKTYKDPTIYFDEKLVDPDISSFPISDSNDQFVSLFTKNPFLIPLPTLSSNRTENAKQIDGYLITFTEGNVYIAVFQLLNEDIYYFNVKVELNNYDEIKNVQGLLKTIDGSIVSDCIDIIQYSKNSLMKLNYESNFFQDQPQLFHDDNYIDCKTYQNTLKYLNEEIHPEDYADDGDIIYFAEEIIDQLNYNKGVGYCNQHDLTTLNHTCIADFILSGNNPSISQNYHFIERSLQLVSTPLQLLPSNQDFLFTNNPSTNTTIFHDYTNFLFGFLILVIITAIIFGIYRFKYSKKKRSSSSSSNNNDPSNFNFRDNSTTSLELTQLNTDIDVDIDLDLDIDDDFLQEENLNVEEYT